LKPNLLHISSNFNFVCGVSRHVLSLLTSVELGNSFNQFLVINGGDALQKLDNSKIKYSIIDFKTDSLLHHDAFKNYSQLKKFCQKNKINIVHSHHRYPALISGLLSKSLDIKTVTTAHNFVKYFKSFSYKSDKIIAVSKSVKAHLTGYFNIPSGKIEVLYNFAELTEKVDFNSNAIVNQLNISRGIKIILYAGRIIEEKGINTLIDAFNLLTREINNVNLILLGEGKLSKHYSTKISDNQKIHLMSTKGDVSEYFKMADVVVLPSRKEPLGYTMLDSGLLKVPFVGTNAGGISEIITDGVNGFLFEPGNKFELVDKLKYVLTHPEELSLASENLQKKIKEECNREKYINRLIGIYSGLLNKDDF
jgi:glycosyltransferase involved in cell wall biosynthesis